jgi:RimJ/RimL family protein N-acetyltransferase
MTTRLTSALSSIGAIPGSCEVDPVEIRTDRLRLRELHPDDWKALHAYHNDPRYLRYYPNESESEVATRLFVETNMAPLPSSGTPFIPRNRYALAITLLQNETSQSGTAIGTVGIRLRSLGGHDTGVPQADIGYEIDPQYWGRGYATEAARAIVVFGFTTLGAHRIWAQCIAENRASARVLEKVGMRLEGRLREDEHFKGRRWDTLIYAILISEWHSTLSK